MPVVIIIRENDPFMMNKEEHFPRFPIEPLTSCHPRVMTLSFSRSPSFIERWAFTGRRLFHSRGIMMEKKRVDSISLSQEHYWVIMLVFLAGSRRMRSLIDQA